MCSINLKGRGVRDEGRESWSDLGNYGFHLLGQGSSTPHRRSGTFRTVTILGRDENSAVAMEKRLLHWVVLGRKS